jgi:hypothetical protein
MNTSKFLIGTLAGGITMFLLGYLCYAVLFENFFQAHAGTATGVQREMVDIVWWALILGNLLQGGLLSYIFLKWANIKTFATGLTGGIVIGIFLAFGVDLIYYSTSNISDLTSAIVDAIVYTVMFGITGGVVGWALGMGKAQAA